MTVITKRPIDKYLEAMRKLELFYYPTWEEWLSVDSPYPAVGFRKERVFTRFNRNGYDWDINGALYTPDKEIDPSIAWLVTLGTNGSEGECDVCPDGRPGIAPLLAARGFKVMTCTFPGHFYPPDGNWPMAVADRKPIYLFGQELSDEEIADRDNRCTIDTSMQGVGLLVDKHLAGRGIVCTNGQVHGRLPAFIAKTRIVGMASIGFGGQDGWRLKWAEKLGKDPFIWHWPVDGAQQKKSTDTFKKSGYESDKMLTPWGGADEFIREVSRYRSQLKSTLTVNQHDAAVEELEQYVKMTGLPRGEYFDFLNDPAPGSMKGQGILMFVGMHDKKRWIWGDDVEEKWEVFMARQYQRFADRVHMIPVPHHGHFAMTELHNEKFVYHWLWSHKDGYFEG
jgi:hypothetical protein